MTVDNHIKQMMRDLAEALARAMSDSAEINQAIQRLRQHGYSVHMVVDRSEDRAHTAKIELSGPKRSSTQEVAFRLGQEDVSLLRQLGIDATRARPRRRTP